MMCPGNAIAGVVQEAGVLHRRRADDDVADAVVEIALDGVEIADAAAQLDRHVLAHRRDDLLDRRLVLGLAGDRAVEVDQMQAARALIEPVTRHRAPGLRKTRWHRAMSPCFRRTQCPSLRSIAGMSSMVRLSWEWARVSSRVRAAGARDTFRSESQFPAHEIAKKRKSGLRAFFRVELHRENIILRRRGGKVDTVFGAPGGQRPVIRHDEVAVNQVKARERLCQATMSTHNLSYVPSPRQVLSKF